MRLRDTLRHGWSAPVKELMQGSLVALPFSALLTFALERLVGDIFVVEIVFIGLVQFLLSLIVAGWLMERTGR